MRCAFVDSSCIVAVLFREAGGAATRRELTKLDVAFAANLVEAEVRSAANREGLADVDQAMTGLQWVLPDQPLSDQISRILGTAHLRGADLWHLACGSFLRESLGAMPFLTLDARQAAAARAVGFRSMLA